MTTSIIAVKKKVHPGMSCPSQGRERDMGRPSLSECAVWVPVRERPLGRRGAVGGGIVAAFLYGVGHDGL